MDLVCHFLPTKGRFLKDLITTNVYATGVISILDLIHYIHYIYIYSYHYIYIYSYHHCRCLFAVGGPSYIYRTISCDEPETLSLVRGSGVHKYS